MEREWSFVAMVGDIDSDLNVLQVEAFGETLCIGLTESGVFAVQDRCPHGDASLSEGWVENGTLVCPLHQGSFDLASGEPVDPPACEALKTFAARIEDGQIFVRCPLQ